MPPRKSLERGFVAIRRRCLHVSAIFLWLATAGQPAAGQPPAEPAPEAEAEAVRYYPQFTLLTLGSVGTRLDDLDDRGVERTDTTVAGTLDVLLQGVFSDHFSILAQLAADAENGGDEDFLIEQLQLAYARSDAFKLRLGKFHTALGYWNRTYHNIPWLATSIFPPEIFRLEGEGGILPVHSVGLEASGIRPAGGKLDFAYSLGVVKGRTAVLGETVDLDDVGDAEALNLHLALKRTSEGRLTRELAFGLSGYAETIPEDRAVPGRRGEIDELIVGAYVAWSVANGELLAEYLRIRHRDEVSGRDFESEGFYYQYSLVFRRWKIYERFDLVNFDDADPYFATLGDRRDIRRLTTGVRWDVRTWLGLTAEYSWATRDRLPDSNRLAVQLAFSLEPLR